MLLLPGKKSLWRACRQSVRRRRIVWSLKTTTSTSSCGSCCWLTAMCVVVEFSEIIEGDSRSSSILFLAVVPSVATFTRHLLTLFSKQCFWVQKQDRRFELSRRLNPPGKACFGWPLSSVSTSNNCPNASFRGLSTRKTLWSNFDKCSFVDWSRHCIDYLKSMCRTTVFGETKFRNSSSLL